MNRVTEKELQTWAKEMNCDWVGGGDEFYLYPCQYPFREGRYIDDGQGGAFHFTGGPCDLFTDYLQIEHELLRYDDNGEFDTLKEHPFPPLLRKTIVDRVIAEHVPGACVRRECGCAVDACPYELAESGSLAWWRPYIKELPPDERIDEADFSAAHGKDLSEWVESGGTAEAFASVLDQAEPHPANAKKFSRRQTLPPNRTHDGKQADCIIRLTADIELFHDPDMEPYATIPLPGHLETWPLNAREFRLVLQYRYFNHYGSTPSDQAMKEALATLSGQARFRGGCYPVRVRTAEHDGAIYLDLANKQWECVKITAQGWEIITNPPVKFRRSYGQGALPAPVKGGSVDALRQFVNVGSEDDWALVKGFVLYAFRPRGPYPVLAVNGEQGSAKSTTTKVIREIVDPNKASLRTQPREEQDLIIAAHNGWMPCLDNLSHLDSWLSDALCRLATGGGLSKRQLYTDSSEVILDVQRPLVLNGIENFVVRGDLQSRALTISAPAIDDKDRKTEEEFWRDFYQALPGILGAFLSALSQAIAHADHVKLPTLPRMADFARFVTAAEPALSISSGGFLAAYQGNQRESNDTVLESSPVAALLQQFLQDQPCWEGTASELLTELNSKVDEDTRRQKAWPKAPNRLSGALKRLAPNLRATGVVVGWLNRGPKRRLVRLEKARREHQDNEHLDGSSGPSSIVMPMINKTNEMTIRDDYDDTWPNESAL